MSARNSRKNKAARREQRNVTAQDRKRLHTNAQYRIQEAPDGTQYKDFGICGTCWICSQTDSTIDHNCVFEFFEEEDMQKLRDTVDIVKERRRLRESLWTP